MIPSPIEQAVAASPVFPPSFDGSPLVFGLTLFGRSLLLILACATIVRLRSRARGDCLSADSPAFYRYLFDMCVLLTVVLGSLSDVAVWLAWGEVESGNMELIMIGGGFFNAASAIPFCMALFVPFWMYWLRKIGVVKPQGPLLLKAAVVDLKLTWGQPGVPLSLAAWCFVGAAGVTVGKYLAWLGEVHAAG